MIDIAFRLKCNRCRTVSESFDGSAEEFPLAIRDLQTAGWTTDRAGLSGSAKDLCPACVAKQSEVAA